MAYTLHRLAAGSYDLARDAVIIGCVVREVLPSEHIAGWRVELLDDPPKALRPHPFKKIEHYFPTLKAVLAWLGDARVIESD